MDIQVSLTVTSKTPISILLDRYFPVFAVSAGLHCIPHAPLGTAAHTHARSLIIKDHFGSDTNAEKPGAIDDDE